MRTVMAAALLMGAGLGTAPARAAEIVQTVNPSLFTPFRGFDSSLGTLNGVNLDVNLTTYRQWFIGTPVGSPPNTITWSVNSYFTLVAQGLASNSGLPLTVATSGSGSRAQNDGLFDVFATGAGTFALNPAAFNGAGDFTIAQFDPGLSNPALNGTTMATSVPATTLFQTAGACLGGFQGSDLCGFGNVRLTYSFTPTTAAAVPEPAGWVMMILGFGVVGHVLRRRRPTPRPAHAA